jgi:hypothetical protein
MKQWEDVDWTDLHRIGEKWRVDVNVVINSPFS